MVTLNEMQEDFHATISENPMPARIQYFGRTFSGTDYDDSYRTRSGATIWVNCMHFPIKATEAQFLPQGHIIMGDSKFYVHGSIALNEDVQIGLGSPVADNAVYGIMEGGIENWPSVNGCVYRKAFIRNLNAGSFVQQY